MRRHVTYAGLAAVTFLLAVAPVSAQERAARAVRGEQVYTAQGCYGCHQIGKVGTPIGPNLSGIGAKYSPTYLNQWLRDPESVRPSAHMPKLELTADDIESLAAYLASLK
jgi:cytochrome c oxidase subunit 2